MKIPKKLPQFEGLPVLFVTSGEYEAHFFIAHNGEIEGENELKMAPREEAREKQAFTGHKAGMEDLISVSHRGQYIADLKMKFAHKFHDIIHGILAEYHMEEIYIFAPKFVIVRIMAGLDKSEQKKVRMQFYKEYTKESPLKLIKVFNAEIEEIQKAIKHNPENNPFTLLK